VAPVQDANDDFLPDVAAFRKADSRCASMPASSGIVSSSMSATEHTGTPDSNAYGFGRPLVELVDASRHQGCLQRAGLGALHEEVESRLAGVGDTRGRSPRRPPTRPARCRVRASRASAASGAPLTIDATLAAASGPMTAICAKRVGDVAELHVLREDELIELRHHARLSHTAAHRQQQDVAELVGVEVRDHASLRGEIRGVAAPAPAVSATISLVNRPWRYDARSVPENDNPAAIRTIDERPRDGRAASYAAGETSRIMVLC